ncbi:MAG: hypothetical protein KDG89_06620 [Geminicoccaceae bacterium]|nr:hypothetical protein [Geminicoccaceae bacterium]
MTSKPKRDGPLKVPFAFDDAMQRALKVKPPIGGWKAFERAKAKANRRDRKPETTDEESDEKERQEDS